MVYVVLLIFVLLLGLKKAIETNGCDYLGEFFRVELC